MSWKDKKDTFLQVLKQTGLNHNEATIYFELIKHGIKGTTAYDLDRHFPEIKRTTIYSILRKLISLGRIQESNSSESPNKATIFTAIEPKEYFDRLISEKQEELDFFINLKENNADFFDIVYSSGLEYTIDEVDEFIQPYLKPLINSRWIISSYYVKEDVPVFGYSLFDTMSNPPMYTVYDIMLNPPEFKLLRENSFHLFQFNFDIEHDKNAYNFFIESLKKQTNQIISFFSDIEEFTYEEKPINIFDINFDGLNLKIKKKDLGKIFDNIKSKIRGYWIGNEELMHLNTDFEINADFLESEDQIEVWKAVLIPLNNKVFFLWSESIELLQMMAAPIFDIEEIPSKSKK